MLVASNKKRYSKEWSSICGCIAGSRDRHISQFKESRFSPVGIIALGSPAGISFIGLWNTGAGVLKTGCGTNQRCGESGGISKILNKNDNFSWQKEINHPMRDFQDISAKTKHMFELLQFNMNPTPLTHCISLWSCLQPLWDSSTQFLPAANELPASLICGKKHICILFAYASFKSQSSVTKIHKHSCSFYHQTVDFVRMGWNQRPSLLRSTLTWLRHGEPEQAGKENGWIGHLNRPKSDHFSVLKNHFVVRLFNCKLLVLSDIWTPWYGQKRMHSTRIQKRM